MCFKTDTKIRKGIDEDSISLKKMTESRCWCESGMSIHWKKIPSKPQPEMTDQGMSVIVSTDVFPALKEPGINVISD